MSSLKDKRPTLRNLAAKLGLGVSTVSQALRDSPEIAAATRERVKTAATEAGYIPNRAGVRLRTGKTNILSLVLNPEDDGSGFFTNMIYGISDALAGSRYHLVVTPYSLHDPMEPIRFIAETHAADGIIISRTTPDDPRVSYLSAANIPFITHGRSELGISHCYYDFDNHAYICEALRRLKLRGRRRVALFGPPPGLTYAAHTLAGFRDGLQATGMEGHVVQDVHSDSASGLLQVAAKALVHVRNRPDAIICTSAREAIAVASGLRAGGMEMGRDYDLVAKPISELARLALPDLIGIEEDHRAAGRELARMLIAHIDGAPVSALQMIAAPATA